MRRTTSFEIPGQLGLRLSVPSVPLVKLAVTLKDRSHVRCIFTPVQNPKRIAHTVCFKVSFQENHYRLLFLAEFVTNCHGFAIGQMLRFFGDQFLLSFVQASRYR